MITGDVQKSQEDESSGAKRPNTRHCGFDDPWQSSLWDPDEYHCQSELAKGELFDNGEDEKSCAIEAEDPPDGYQNEQGSLEDQKWC